MDDNEFSIDLKCLFCDSPLKGKSERHYNSGDMLKCQECNELNDYDSLIDVATEEGKALITEHALNEINKILEDTLK